MHSLHLKSVEICCMYAVQMSQQLMPTYRPQLREVLGELVCHLKTYHYFHVNSAEAALFRGVSNSLLLFCLLFKL